MKRIDLIKIIEKNGAVFIRHGGNHDWYKNPKTGIAEAIPRHREIKDASGGPRMRHAVPSQVAPQCLEPRCRAAGVRLLASTSTFPASTFTPTMLYSSARSNLRERGVPFVNGQGLTVVIGHTNSDLDCFGSMVLARYLYSGALLVRSDRIHPVARNIEHAYGSRLDLVSRTELNTKNIARIVIVDTRALGRIAEYAALYEGFGGEVIVYDHHVGQEKTIPCTRFVERPFGANTTLIGAELMARGLRPHEDDATIALAGIYADTGNFTHDTVAEDDFLIAAWLRTCGASIEIVREFLKPLSDKNQISIFHNVLSTRTYHEFRGHSIIIAKMHLDQQTSGLAAIVEKVHEVENQDATFVLFEFVREKSVLIIGRSTRDLQIDSLLASFGGGGHEHAASATIKGANVDAVFEELKAKLETEISPAICAKDILERDRTALVDPCFILENMKLIGASKYLEETNRTGSVVVDISRGRLLGVLTLRDIQKGRKINKMQSPVTAYMTRNVISVKPDAGIRRIEATIREHNIKHLPVVDDDEVVLGVIDRDKLVEYMRERNKRERTITENVHAALQKYGDYPLDLRDVNM